MTFRFKIVGTVQMDPQSEFAGFARESETAHEQVLLSLTLTDAMADSPGWRSRRLLRWPAAGRCERMFADLDALMAELQQEWAQLDEARP